PPKACGLPAASHYRPAGQRPKDACGTARARPGPKGPVLNPHRQLARDGSNQGKQPCGHAAMPCKSQNDRKTAGRTLLTPARSFRDDLLLPGNDCWVFDNQRVQFNYFSGIGDFLAAELSDE